MYIITLHSLVSTYTTYIVHNASLVILETYRYKYIDTMYEVIPAKA